MKRLILFIISLLFFTACIAQPKFNKSEIKAEKIIFVCEKLNDPTSEIIVVHNKDNLLEKTPKRRFGNLSNPSPLLNKEKFIETFWKVFGEKRLKELLPEKTISIVYYINRAGKILELSYFLRKNTLITPLELEKLECDFFKNISFQLSYDETNTGDYFILLGAIPFQKILDKTY